MTINTSTFHSTTSTQAGPATGTAAPPAAAPVAPAPAAPGVTGGLPGMPPPAAVPGTQVTGPNGEQGVFLSEEAYLQDMLKESHALHLVVLGACAAIAMIVPAIGAVGELGIAGAIGAAVGAVIGLVIGALIHAGVGWLVGKMFAADFGSVPVLLLRFAALAAAYTVSLGVLTLAVGPLFAMVLAVPVLMGLSVWLIGMDLVQAIVYAMVLSLVNWMLISFMLASLGVMMANAGV
ncbi:MAG: hypothetical protein ACYTG1_03975 [Planctomycetota bacterium]|jgi:hypothetical protein